jgi:glycine C-acetyltransferase
MTMTYNRFLEDEIDKLKETGLYKAERVITTPQSSHINVINDQIDDVINLCANNYLGLADHPEIISDAHQALDDYGYGMASVRFICGTQTPHKQLEARISQFLGREDTILYSSCYSATLGLFAALMGPEDAIISDALNHACLIDGIRLSKAERHLYANSNMLELEEKLQQTQHARFRLIATDGVFSMDGYMAKLPEICDLAEKYNAMVMVDDSHAVGVVGPKGKGTPAYHGVEDRVHVLTGTLGKALGGSAGGYVTGNRAIIEWLRQKSRTYLFSNALPPVICAGSIKAIDLLENSDHLLEKLKDNTAYFRREMEALGFKLLPGSHPIIPVMLGDAKLAGLMASQLFEEGIYVVGFSYPVVPMNEARIRVQMSAAHSKEDLEKAVFAFACVGRRLRII